MAATSQSAIAVIGIDIGKNSFHVVGLDGRNNLTRLRPSRHERYRVTVFGCASSRGLGL